MYLDDADNKIKLDIEDGDLEYLIDAYIKLEGTILDSDGDSLAVKDEICGYVCSNISCENIECKNCPFNIASALTLKNLELVIQEEYQVLNI